MTSVRRSLAILFAERYTGFMISIVSTMIIARLLTPGEIGTFSIAVSATALIHTLRNFGIPAYLIQETNLDRYKKSTAFGLMLIISWLFGVLLFSSSGPISVFYAVPEIATVLQILSVNFLLIPFGSIHLALLRRDMKFGTLYKIRTTEALVGASVSVYLAWNGHGILALAFGELAGMIALLTMTAFHKPSAFFIRPTLTSWRTVLPTGARISGTHLFSELGNSGPDLIIGRILGIEPVGYFSRANGLVMTLEKLVTQVAMGIALPYFAAKKRADEMKQELYQRTVLILVGVTWPLLAIIGVLADPLIFLFFGDQWGQAVVLAQILCFSMAFRTINRLNLQVYIALGASAMALKIQAINQPLKLVLVLAACLIDLRTVAVAYIVSEFVGLVIYWIAGRRLIGFKITNLFLGLIPTILISMGTGLSTHFGYQFFSTTGPLPAIEFLAAGIIGSTTWIAGLFLLRHPASEEIKVALRHVATKGNRRI